MARIPLTTLVFLFRVPGFSSGSAPGSRFLLMCILESSRACHPHGRPRSFQLLAVNPAVPGHLELQLVDENFLSLSFSPSLSLFLYSVSQINNYKLRKDRKSLESLYLLGSCWVVGWSTFQSCGNKLGVDAEATHLSPHPEP